MKTAVVYFSLEGNTGYAAVKTAQALGVDCFPLIPVTAYPDKGFKKFFFGGKSATMKEVPALQPHGFCAADYDRVVLCSPVWAGTFAPPLRTFLRENDLRGKQIAVIACSSGGNAAKCIDGLRAEAKADALCASLSLIDPKKKPTEKNEALLAEFIETLKSQAD